MIYKLTEGFSREMDGFGHWEKPGSRALVTHNVIDVQGNKMLPDRFIYDKYNHDA